MNTRCFAVLGALAVSLPAAAQQVTLKIAHFLPSAAPTQQRVLQPWCDDLGKESAGRIVCQFYPAMQLGGTPSQLVDQVKNGIADVVWTGPGYSAGRFPAINLQNVLARFGTTTIAPAVDESLAPVGAQSLRDYIDEFAARRSTTPRALKTDERRSLLRELKESGLLEVRRAIDTVAQHLGVSRTTLYLDARRGGR